MGIPWGGTGINCYGMGMGQINMSHGQPWRHQTGAQYSAVECTRAIRRVVAPAPQLEPASRLRTTTRDVSFLRSDSKCPRYVSDLSNVTPSPRYLGSEQKGRVSFLYLTFKLTFSFFVVRMEGCQHRFCGAEL